MTASAFSCYHGFRIPVRKTKTDFIISPLEKVGFCRSIYLTIIRLIGKLAINYHINMSI